jgi:hypothetical protein
MGRDHLHRCARVDIRDHLSKDLRAEQGVAGVTQYLGVLLRSEDLAPEIPSSLVTPCEPTVRRHVHRRRDVLIDGDPRN